MKPATGGPGTRQARRLLRFVLPTASAIGVVVPRRAVADLAVRAAPVRRAFGSVRRLGRLSCPAPDRDVARGALFEFFPDVGGRAPAFRWHAEFHLDVVLAPLQVVASSRLLCRWFTRPPSAMTTPLIAYSTARLASVARCHFDLP
jgi:hypothetical protein